MGRYQRIVGRAAENRRTDHFLLYGGLDLVSGAVNVPKRHMIAGVNYLPTDGGYRRIEGYERFDGRPAPSDATYSVLRFDAASAVADMGDTLTGAMSGATATIIVDPILDDDSTTAGRYVISDIDGVFEDNEALNVSGDEHGIANGTPIENDADDIATHQKWRAAAADNAREAIEAVAEADGVGPVRGICVLNGVIYAFRDDGTNDPPTSAGMWEATEDGWMPVDLGVELPFSSGGATAIERGGTVEGATSSASGTVARVDLMDGSWAGGDAEGVMIVTGVTGTFVDENLNYTPEGGMEVANNATIADASVNTLAAGGTYEFVTHNFYGGTDRRRVYGANGVGRAFSFDGHGFRFVRTGASDALDKPLHVAVRHNQLLLGYDGGALTNAVPGEPHDFDAATPGTPGAVEQAVGQNIVDLLQGAGAGATLVLGDDHVQALFGQDSDSWTLVDQSGPQTGAIRRSAQYLDRPLYLDSRGVRRVVQLSADGQMQVSTLTYMVQPFLDALRAEGREPTASIAMFDRSQYWLFFPDRRALVIYTGRKHPECALVELQDVVHSIVSWKDEKQRTRMMFGSDDGWVYELNRGTSFDGEAIECFLRLAYNAFGDPNREDKVFLVTLYSDVPGQSIVNLSGSYSYGNGADTGSRQVEMFGGGANWDEAEWDEFYWDAPLTTVTRVPFGGQGTSLSLVIEQERSDELAHTITGIAIDYAPRRKRR